MEITKNQINKRIEALLTKIENEKVTITKYMKKYEKTSNVKYSNKVIAAKNKAVKMLEQIDRWKVILKEKFND